MVILRSFTLSTKAFMAMFMGKSHEPSANKVNMVEEVLIIVGGATVALLQQQQQRLTKLILLLHQNLPLAVVVCNYWSLSTPQTGTGPGTVEEREQNGVKGQCEGSRKSDKNDWPRAKMHKNGRTSPQAYKPLLCYRYETSHLPPPPLPFHREPQPS